MTLVFLYTCVHSTLTAFVKLYNGSPTYALSFLLTRVLKYTLYCVYKLQICKNLIIIIKKQPTRAIGARERLCMPQDR